MNKLIEWVMYHIMRLAVWIMDEPEQDRFLVGRCGKCGKVFHSEKEQDSHTCGKESLKW